MTRYTMLLQSVKFGFRPVAITPDQKTECASVVAYSESQWSPARLNNVCAKTCAEPGSNKVPAMTILRFYFRGLPRQI